MEDASDWTDLSRADALSEGDLRTVRVAGRALCLGRSPAGYFALDDLCPHAGGSLGEGLLDGLDVICPLHGFAFDSRNGACGDDPRCTIRAYPVRIERGILQVKT